MGEFHNIFGRLGRAMIRSFSRRQQGLGNNKIKAACEF